MKIIQRIPGVYDDHPRDPLELEGQQGDHRLPSIMYGRGAAEGCRRKRGRLSKGHQNIIFF